MDTVDEIGLVIKSVSWTETETNNYIKWEFNFNNLRLLNKALQSLQIAGYPACRLSIRGKGCLKVQVNMRKSDKKIELPLLEDWYSDIAKVNATGPKDSLQKNVDYRFSKETVWPPEKPFRGFKKRDKKINKPKSSHPSDDSWLNGASI